MKVSRVFRWGFAILLAGLVFFLAAQPRANAADDKWRARYFNNRNVSGDPVFRRDENNIDHDWGSGGPGNGVNSDNFSARWTRTVNFSGGTYRFFATMDDGMRVWVDDRLIIDDWNDSQVRTRTADVALSPGDHAIEVQYYEAGGVAVAKFSWTAVGGQPPATTDQWRGEYFPNRNLSGGPSLVRNDGAIDFNWGTGSPGDTVPSDNFSARWTRNPYFPGGTYRFVARMDDGMRVYVDDRLIIDDWREAPDRTRTADLELSTGNHRVEVQYFEAGGSAIAKFSWSQLGGTTPPVTGGGWFGEYFTNQWVSGAPALTRGDSAINFNWGNGAPAAGIPADHFSVRWSQTVNAAPGRYRVSVTADDGVRVWVNNNLVIDEWRENQNKTFQRELDLPGGATPVRVEYYENMGSAFINANFSFISGISPTPQPVVPGLPGGQQAVVANASWLNVRRTPEVADNIIMAIPRGRVVDMNGRYGGWVQVRVPQDNIVGWVSARYLASNYPISSLPVVQP
jgi:hypothetical protein